MEHVPALIFVLSVCLAPVCLWAIFVNFLLGRPFIKHRLPTRKLFRWTIIGMGGWIAMVFTADGMFQISATEGTFWAIALVPPCAGALVTYITVRK